MILKTKNLRPLEITFFNSILSARLICILDFIFAETTLTEPSAWLTNCWPTTGPYSDLPSRSRILAFVANAHRQAPRKSNIAGVR